jgi:DNA-binding cell septation regulator SpoVG
MISVLNFKPFDRGSIMGFFDLLYHGLTIKSCRLMKGTHGLWFSFPQIKAEVNGETKYLDQIFLTPPECKHVRKLVLMDLQLQGYIEQDKAKPSKAGRHKTPEGEDLSEYYREPSGEIPF